MVNGTYICQKHDQILQDAEQVFRLAKLNLEDFTLDDEVRESFSEVLDLAEDIIELAKTAKLDGQSMENRLVERAMQSVILTDLATGLKNLSDAIRTNEIP